MAEERSNRRNGMTACKGEGDGELKFELLPAPHKISSEVIASCSMLAGRFGFTALTATLQMWFPESFLNFHFLNTLHLDHYI